ncbi:MAG: hypothetical protein ACE5LG_03645 [Anaerolineae bacterium]
MSEETEGAEGEIAEELKRLGRQLHSTAKAAWESEERRQLEAEIVSGLNALASEIERTLRESRVSAEGEVLEVKAREVKEKTQSGELGVEVRSGFLRVLRQINAELDRLQNSWAPAEKAEEEKE